jgi:hypothetical protein
MIGLDGGLRSDRIALIRGRIDAAGAGATLAVQSGTRPATGAGSATALVTFVLPYPCGSVAGPVLTLAQAAPVTAVGVGDATWARIKDAAGAFVADLGVGAIGSSEEVWLDELNIQPGRTVEFVSGELTEGNP